MTTTDNAEHGSRLDAPLLPGEQVGEYIIEEQIGVGGFGTVYRAQHPLIGKEVAIKVLGVKLSADPEMVSRFIAEARSVNQIQSKYIIDIFGFGQLADGRQYYIMELLDGMPLDEYLDQSGCVPLAEAVPILRGIAKALDAAHKNGVAHRDLKPENVFLVRDEAAGFRPKLLDFGIAKLLGDKESMHKTRTGAPIGTPLYMSPEQCRGKGVDHRTDIYAFGCMTYRLLTGVVPFDGDGYMDILFKQIQTEPSPPTAVNPALPRAVDGAIARMMAKEPDARPATLAEAVRDLEAAAVSAGVTLPPGTSSAMFTPLPSTTGRRPMASGTAATVASGIGAGERAPETRKVLTIAAVLGTLALAAALAVMIMTRGSGDESGAGAAEVPIDAIAAVIASENAKDAAAIATETVTDPSFITIDIAGVPRGTEVLWGPRGVIGGAPGRIQLAFGREPLTLQLRADGFTGKTLEVLPDHDQEFALELEALPTARRGTRGKGSNAGKDGAGGKGGKGTGSGINSIEDPFEKNK